MSERKIEVFVSGVTEQRGDHYAAYVKGLGMTAYGPTIESARERALLMIETVLADAEARLGRGYVTKWLTRAGVDYRDVSEGSWQASVIHSSELGR